MNLVNYLVIFITLASVNGYRSYDGYKLYKVEPKNKDEVSVLLEVQRSGMGEFWEDSFDVNHIVRVMVAAHNQEEFLAKMKTVNMEVKEIIPDVQKAIQQQLIPATRNAQTTESFHGFSWDVYHNLATIYSWLDDLVAAYPGVVSPIVMGRSVENREIRGVKIDFNPNRATKYIGMIESTLHAREWITSATATWVIKEFLTSTDPAIRAMAEDLEWHIFPVVNPDGYEYTFTTHRMWRKNRSPESFQPCEAYGQPDDMSNGVDLNRNFGYAWMSVGASNNSCTNTFAGPTAFSEPESRAIAQYALNLNEEGKLVYYVALHSYTQLIIMPYSHVSSSDVLLNSNYGDMYEIAKRSSDAISKRFGTTYRVGVSADVLYPMSGTSFDYVKYATNVPVSYLFELRDLGEYGFLLPPEQIVPNNLEVMDGLVEMDRTTRMLGYLSAAPANVVSIVLLSLAAFVCVLFN